MPFFQWVESFKSLRLDVVGIVAVLGEGCTARTIDASSLTWHHLLPRLLPAPQALLKHERNTRLSTEDGTVVSVLSGNHSSQLNHFCRLLHYTPLPRNTVELVQVSRRNTKSTENEQAFSARKFGHLGKLSVLGATLSIALLVASLVMHDGFAFSATLLLSSTSTIVGYASRWRLDLEIPKPQTDREDDIPSSDLVIYYPTGAFRVIRCREEVSRLYFTPEVCKRDITDNMYRFLALLASVFLMIGLLCMGNCQTELQLAFAAAYIFLNICYWVVSAQDPMKHHWAHDYDVQVLKYMLPIKKLPDPVIIKEQDKSTNGNNDQPDIPDGQGNGNTYPMTSISAARSEPSGNQHTRANTVPNGTSDATVTGATSIMARIRFLSRRQRTDLEGMRQRSESVLRAAAPTIQRTFSRTLSGLFLSKAPVENEEQRRFTQALWITIALTGSGQWLNRTRIAPDTDVWRKWIDLAERRILSRRNDRGQLVPALTEVNGSIALPPWNYDGTLKQLLQKEKEEKKNRPPPPPTLTEILWGGPRHNTQGFISLTLGARIKLRRWAGGARDRVKQGNLLPLPSFSQESGQTAADASGQNDTSVPRLLSQKDQLYRHSPDL